MPELRQPVTRRRFWIKWIAAAVLAAAAIFDWTRPPGEQKSPYLFEKVVVVPYRVFVRPVTSLVVRCRYRPTCSAYAVQAVHVHGFPKGVWLATKRLLRCMPWVPLGTADPVPPK